MTEPTRTFRIATPDDAEALLAIYAPYIDTNVTNETVVPTLEQFRQRVVDRDGVYPWVVCEEDGRLVGYSYGSRLFVRQGFDWAAELSVYCATDHRGHGLGRQLYTKLIDLLQLQGIRSVIGKVTAPNPGSGRLHESLGFRQIGVYDNISYKLGEWRSVTVWEKHINDIEAAPEPLKPFGEVDPAAVQKILEA